MSTSVSFPPIFTPPVQGIVVKIHRLPGFFVGYREPIVDVQLGLHILTLCAPEAGKVMRCRKVGAVVNAGDTVTEVTGVATPTWELFVAYRWADDPGYAGHIAQDLIAHFGKGQVFRDIDSVAIGDDFVTDVREKLQRAHVMVVIIGPEWAQDSRLQDPDDLHREEVRTAINRGIQIVPVLVHGATMPRKEELPEDIRALATKRAHEISDTRWDYDIGVLFDVLTKALENSPRRQRFLAQVPPWGYKGYQWITDDPPPGDPPVSYE